MTKNCVCLSDSVQQNDYGIFAASISLWKDQEVAKFNSLFTLTSISDLEKDLKNQNLKRAYIFHGYMDMILALSRIWNVNQTHLLKGDESFVKILCEQMKVENANPQFINYLSNLTTNGIEITGKSTLKIKNTNLEIVGLDDSINEITLVWVPELETMVLGKNLLKNLKGIEENLENQKR